MNISDLLAPERVACRSDLTSKKRTLEVLGEMIATAQTDLSAQAIFDSLIGRERLGSTGLGHGVALPHGRLSRSRHAVGAFIRLEQGVDFDALDQQPVNLLFALLVPEHFTDEHLKILAYLAEMFSDRRFCETLRNIDDDQLLFQHLNAWEPFSSLP